MAEYEDVAAMENWSHDKRVKYAIELGKRARTDPRVAAQLRGWCKGGFTQRLLAAFACQGSRDAAVLLELTSDESQTVSRVAVAILCDVGDSDTLLAALRAIPPRRAVKALFWLRRSRIEVVDRFIAERVEAADQTAWLLVPLGSVAILDRYFAAAAEYGGMTFWKRAAVFHAERVVSEIVSRLNAATNPDGFLFSYARTVIAILSNEHPESTLTVVESLRRHIPLASIPLQTLAVRRSVTVADLVLSSTDNPSVNFERVAHRLGASRIVALFRRSPHFLGYPQKWLAKLAAVDRLTIFRELATAWTSPEGLVPVQIVRRLPASIRPDEARRAIALPALAARPLDRLPYAGLLPWSEALQQVKAWLGHPEAGNRGAAITAVCEATRFDRTRLAELLLLLGALKYEQDPVRMAFLQSLADLPPERWQTDNLANLGRIIRDALDAADLSWMSVAAIGRFVLRILPFHPQWAIGQLAELTRERGFPSSMDRLLTPEEIRSIAQALTPIIQKWLDREHEERLVVLGATMGRRLPEWPELAKVLEHLITGAVNQTTAASAMGLIAKHLPAERERVITTALAGDESWVLQSPVMNYLHAHRQDLLTPFLGQRAYAGRFSTGKVRYVLPLASGFHRWTDAQQEIFAQSLSELARPPIEAKDAEVTWDVLNAVRRLPALPAIGPERLIVLARDKRPAIQEAAVRALGRLDARQGIPELLEALGDSRARLAIYALRSALSELPPSRVLEIMRKVPLGKVTVAKEAVRLAGEFGGAAALGWFTELDREALHRDVRGAMLRALWDHLERPEAWAILDRWVSSPDAGVVIGLARIQVDRASVAARARVANLLLRLLQHSEPTVRLAVLKRLDFQPVPDPKRSILTATLSMLTSAIPDERSAALRAAIAGAADTDAPAFATAFTALLPNRREIALAANEFARKTIYFGERLLAVRSRVLEAVETDPKLVSLQIRLAAARFAAEPFARWLSKLIGTARWHTGTQTTAFDLVIASSQPAADLERAEVFWASTHDPAARWLALRLLARVASDQGWTTERRERLDQYRRDPSAMVSDEAALIFPPETEKIGGQKV